MCIWYSDLLLSTVISLQSLVSVKRDQGKCLDKVHTAIDEGTKYLIRHAILYEGKEERWVIGNKWVQNNEVQLVSL